MNQHQEIRFEDETFEHLAGIGRYFVTNLFGQQLHGSTGQYIRDLELIAKATNPADWQNQVEQLPLR
jgi:hypothetical protein